MLGICFGKEINEQKSISSRKILVTNTSLSGKKIKDLNLDTEYGISVVRILRSGVELVAIGDMYIQIGDGLRVVGDEEGTLGPWDRKIECVRAGDIAYGKFLCGGKAAFATIRWYRELMNIRRAAHEPDAAGAQDSVGIL